MDTSLFELGDPFDQPGICVPVIEEAEAAPAKAKGPGKGKGPPGKVKGPPALVADAEVSETPPSSTAAAGRGLPSHSR